MNRLIEKLKKYSVYIHLMVLVAVYAVYYAFPPYGVSPFFNMFIYLVGTMYGISGVWAAKDSLLKNDIQPQSHGILYIFIGALLLLAETIRDSAH